MFSGNSNGLIITILTFVIAIVLTMRQVERTGIHLELTIQPVGPFKLKKAPEYSVDDKETERRAAKDGIASRRIAGKPPPTQ